MLLEEAGQVSLNLKTSVTVKTWKRLIVRRKQHSFAFTGFGNYWGLTKMDTGFRFESERVYCDACLITLYAVFSHSVAQAQFALKTFQHFCENVILISFDKCLWKKK